MARTYAFPQQFGDLWRPQARENAQSTSWDDDELPNEEAFGNDIDLTSEEADVESEAGVQRAKSISTSKANI